MDVGGSRRRSSGGRGTPAATTTTTTVVAGSVWESRIKNDEVRGGFKVFNGEKDNNNNNSTTETTTTTTTPKKEVVKRVFNSINTTSPSSTTTPTKRKTWKSDADPIQIARGIIEGQRLEEVIKDVGVSSPIRAKSAVRSEEKSPIGIGRKPKAKSAEVIKGEKATPIEKIVGSKEDEGIKEDATSDECQDKAISCGDNAEKSIEVEEIKANSKTNNDNDDNNVNEEKVVVVSEVKRVSFERKLEIKSDPDSNIGLQKQSDSDTTISLNAKRQSPVIQRTTIHSTEDSEEYHTFPETHGRLQSLVDLVMWKDISRSAFIFGIGTFTILSSSFTKDLNISFISVISYLGLVYLAAIFLFRTILFREIMDMDNTNYVLGEEEAIWLLRLILPYLNEFLFKLKALFSGDPATTMKLAALLFILARCGSSITIWTMAKLSFFGVFTVPKVCSLYSTHITAYAKFWVRRFRDAWDSCSHKKGVTVAAFLLVWNLSSIVARIWAVFMLFVAFRYYQHNLIADDWVEDGSEGAETWYEPIEAQRPGHGPTIVDHTKQKKIS